MAIEPTSQAGRKFNMVQLRSMFYGQILACVDGLVKALLADVLWMAISFFLLYKLTTMKTKSKGQPRQWIVYILLCSDGSFYTGATNDLEKRLMRHNRGTASKYTRSRSPATLLATSVEMNKGEALRLEMKIKKMPKVKKIACLNGRDTENESISPQISDHSKNIDTIVDSAKLLPVIRQDQKYC